MRSSPRHFVLGGALLALALVGIFLHLWIVAILCGVAFGLGLLTLAVTTTHVSGIARLLADNAAPVLAALAFIGLDILAITGILYSLTERHPNGGRIGGEVIIALADSALIARFVIAYLKKHADESQIRR